MPKTINEIKSNNYKDLSSTNNKIATKINSNESIDKNKIIKNDVILSLDRDINNKVGNTIINSKQKKDITSLERISKPFIKKYNNANDKIESLQTVVELKQDSVPQITGNNTIFIPKLERYLDILQKKKIFNSPIKIINTNKYNNNDTIDIDTQYKMYYNFSEQLDLRAIYVKSTNDSVIGMVQYGDKKLKEYKEYIVGGQRWETIWKVWNRKSWDLCSSIWNVNYEQIYKSLDTIKDKEILYNHLVYYDDKNIQRVKTIDGKYGVGSIHPDTDTQYLHCKAIFDILNFFNKLELFARSG